MALAAPAPMPLVTVSGATAAPIAESIKDVLSSAVERIHGLDAVCVSSCFGLPIVRAVAEGVSPELVAAAETTLAHCFFTVLENAGKMPVGRVRTVCAEYGSVKLVHASLSPLTLCLVGSPRSDIAELQAVGAELARSLAPMQAAADTLTRREDA